MVGGSCGFLALMLFQDVHHRKKVAISFEFFFFLCVKAVKTQK